MESSFRRGQGTGAGSGFNRWFQRLQLRLIDELNGSLLAGTKIAVVARAFFAIFTVIAIKRLTGLHQSIKQRNQPPPPLGQFIFYPPRQSTRS